MNFAIVIAINDYRDKPLAGPVADATAMIEWLTSKTGGDVPIENVTKLLSTPENELALDHHIDIAIDELIENARKYKNDPSNRLYIYFSGHGIGVTFSKTALCLRLWPKLPHSTICTLNYVDGLVNVGLFDEIIMFLDCCREYDLFTGSKDPGFDHKVKVGNRKTKLFAAYSTPYGQLSYEVDLKKTIGDPNVKRGAFTQFLLESLKGDADSDEDDKIYARDLMQHMDDNFKSYADRFKKIQESDYEIKSGGQNILLCTLQRNPNGHNFVVTFKRSGTMQLRNGIEQKIKEEEVSVGTVWELKLPKGTSRIIDLATNEFKVLSNFNPNVISHDEF